MSLVAGTVTVASDATYSGTGLAIGLMNASVAQYDPRVPYTDPNPPHGSITTPLATQIQVLDGYAAAANSTASAITAWLAAGGYT